MGFHMREYIEDTCHEDDVEEWQDKVLELNEVHGEDEED